MRNDMTTATPTEPAGYLPPPPATKQERRAVIYTAGVWLVFMGWTVIGFITSTAPIPAQIAGWLALAAFPVIYLNGFVRPEPFSHLNRHLNTLLYTLALIVLGIIMSLATPTAIINIVSYLMAVWIFNHRLLTGFIATILLIAGSIGVIFFANLESYDDWFIAAVALPAVIMILIRITIELDANQQARSEQLALAAQREDLASTVHDVLGHSLTTITVKVQLAQRLLDKDRAAAKAELADIESVARSSLSEVRAAVTDLQHPDLAEQFNHSAKALAAADIAFQRPEALPRLTLVQQQIFAWVIREAVTNVIRHSEAAECTITITDDDSHRVLRIDDDGVGIHDTNPANHHRLAGLQRRVESAGGKLELAQLHPGTRVEVRL